jgi:hypothetical protein
MNIVNEPQSEESEQGKNPTEKSNEAHFVFFGLVG